MESTDYLVEMTFAPFASLPGAGELATFIERFALPTLEALERHSAEGRIVAGGPALAAGGFHFVARAASPRELEELVSGLPLWPRSQTRVIPLGTFAGRTASVRARLGRARAAS